MDSATPANDEPGGLNTTHFALIVAGVILLLLGVMFMVICCSKQCGKFLDKMRERRMAEKQEAAAERIQDLAVQAQQIAEDEEAQFLAEAQMNDGPEYDGYMYSGTQGHQGQSGESGAPFGAQQSMMGGGMMGMQNQPQGMGMQQPMNMQSSMGMQQQLGMQPAVGMAQQLMQQQQNLAAQQQNMAAKQSMMQRPATIPSMMGQMGSLSARQSIMGSPGAQASTMGAPGARQQQQMNQQQMNQQQMNQPVEYYSYYDQPGEPSPMPMRPPALPNRGSQSRPVSKMPGLTPIEAGVYGEYGAQYYM